MVINITTLCVPFWDVLSFLARSPSFQVLSIQANDPRATFATGLKPIYSSCRPLPSLHEVTDQGWPPPTAKFLPVGWISRCLLGLGVLCVHVFVCVNAGVCMLHVRGGEKTSWVFFSAFHPAYNRVSLSAAVCQVSWPLGFYKCALSTFQLIPGTLPGCIMGQWSIFSLCHRLS